MKQWVRYILNSKDINITDSALEEYIQLYGDSIAHVINEVELLSILIGEDQEINDENSNQLSKYSRDFHLWNLQDSVGMKDLKASIKILGSLLNNGTKITGILISLVFLYQQMLWKKMGSNKPIGYTGINKIITSRLNQYGQLYTHSELEDVLQELRKLDVLSKSTSLKGVSLLDPFIIKICKGEYV
jgi:DNA polymerase III delta subunit